MTPITPPGEDRPTPTTPSGPPASGPPGSSLPLLSLRGERRVIAPEHCRLGGQCLVCAWRKAGLLDRPTDAGDRAGAEDGRPPRRAA